MTLSSRLHRTLRGVLFVFVAGTLLVVVAPVQADTGTLGGMEGSASASGLQVMYIPKGLLPTGAPVDLGAPDSLASITTGPATFARAGVADPGDFLANPDALLAQLSADWEPGTIPSWPLRISARSGLGEPVADSNPAPGLSAHVEANGSSSVAEASSPAVDTPGVITVGSMSSTSTTTTNGSTVTVRARSEVSNLDIAGLVKIRSVVTDLTATSDGTTTTTEGGTTLAGAEIAGIAVTVDSQGMRVDGSGLLPAINLTVLQELLDQLGVTVGIAEPVVMGEGSMGYRASAGLRIEIAASGKDVPLLDDLIGILPPIDNPIPGVPGPEDVIAAIRADHIAEIQLGRAVVSLSASPGYEFVPTPVEIDTPPSAPVAAAPPPPPTATAPSSPTSTPPTSAVPVATAPAPVSTTGEIPIGAGIAGLVVLALLSAPFAGDRIARAATAILAGAGPTTCSVEDP